MHARMQCTTRSSRPLNTDGMDTSRWVDRQGKASSVSRNIARVVYLLIILYVQEIFSKTHSCMHGKLKRVVALILFEMVVGGRRR